MLSRFSDRLDPSHFADDEVWMVALVSVGAPVEWEGHGASAPVAFPERIGQRLRALGQAYRLHVLEGLSSTEQNRLNSQQASSLAEELEFLFELVNDAALRKHGDAVLALAHRCARERRLELVVEGP